MSVHLGSFSALWGLVIFHVTRFFAASGLAYQRLFPGTDWTEYTQTESGELGGTNETSTDVVSLPYNSQIAVQASQEQTTTDMSKSPNSPVGRSPDMKKTRGAATLSFKKQGYPFISLLFVILLAGCIKIWISLQNVRARIPGELEEAGRAASPMREPGGDVARLTPVLTTRTRARLEKIRELLPAAERLASAVGTAKSARLLATVQNILNAENLETFVSNDQKLEDAVKKCLKVFGKLHGIAIARARDIVESDSFLLPLQVLGSFDGTDSAIEVNRKNKIKQQTMRSFSMAYQALFEHVGMLSEQLGHSYDRLLRARQFANEEDGGLLLEAALCVESLRSASKERRYLTTRAVRLKAEFAVGVQTWLLMDLEKAAASLEGDLGLLRVAAAVLQDDSRAGQKSVTQSSSAGESERGWTLLEEIIRQVEITMAEMNAEMKSLSKPTTLSGAVEAARRANALKKKIEGLLENCTVAKDALTRPPQWRSLRLPEALIGVAKKSYLKVSEMNDVLKKATQEVQHRCSQHLETFEDLDENSGQHLNQTVFKRMLRAAENAARTGDACFRNAANLEKEVLQSTTPEAAIKQAQRAKELMQDQSEKMATALWEKLRLALYEFLEEDMSHSNKEAVAACFHSLHLTPSEVPLYERALRQFDCAGEAAREAETLMEATKAVTDMRSCSINIKGIIYRHETKKS